MKIYSFILVAFLLVLGSSSQKAYAVEPTADLSEVVELSMPYEGEVFHISGPARVYRDAYHTYSIPAYGHEYFWTSPTGDIEDQGDENYNNSISLGGFMTNGAHELWVYVYDIRNNLIGYGYLEINVYGW